VFEFTFTVELAVEQNLHAVATDDKVVGIRQVFHGIGAFAGTRSQGPVYGGVVVSDEGEVVLIE
jgi:hypothetical protein